MRAICCLLRSSLFKTTQLCQVQFEGRLNLMNANVPEILRLPKVSKVAVVHYDHSAQLTLPISLPA